MCFYYFIFLERESQNYIIFFPNVHTHTWPAQTRSIKINNVFENVDSIFEKLHYIIK